MGKGTKGKGKESFDQKTERLDAEIARAAEVQDQEGLLHLWSVREGHMNSNWWRTNHQQETYGKGKGKGKGKTESAKVIALQTEIKELKDKGKKSALQTINGRKGRGRSPTPTNNGQRSASRGSSRASSRTSSRGSSKGSKGSVQSKTKQRAARNAAKKEKKRLLKEADKDAPRAPSEPRPTRVCPACFDQTTYANSVKCVVCKVPFSAPIDLAQLAAVAAAPTPTAAEAASRATLKSCQDAAASRIASYAETAKKAVTFAAAQPPPPPPPPPTAAPAAATSVDLSDADKALATKEAAELTSLQTRKQSAEASRATFADDPSMTAALATHIAVLDVAIKSIMDKRQQELQPHQVSIVLSQRQHELTVALMKVTQLEKTTLDGKAAAEKAAKDVHDGYDKEITAMQEAQKAADLAFTTQQLATTARSLSEMTAAQLDVRILQQRVTSLQTTAAGLAPQAATGVTPTPTPTPTPAPTPAGVTPLPMAILPDPPVIEESELYRYALAMSVLEHHQMQDHDFPLRYQDTLCVKDVAKLVGSEVWTTAYPAEAPKNEHNIPKRVLGTLRVVMTRLAISIEARDKVSADRVTEILTTAAEAASTVY